MKPIRLSLPFFLLTLSAPACAPKVIHMTPTEARPGTAIRVSMEYLVGWPRVVIDGVTMDYSQLKLMGLKPDSKGIPGEELTWIEDKVLEFKVPDLPPGDYVVTVHDDKGPPGDPIYSALETTAYVVFPPVWPFVFRSNQAQFKIKVLPSSGP